MSDTKYSAVAHDGKIIIFNKSNHTEKYIVENTHMTDNIIGAICTNGDTSTRFFDTRLIDNYHNVATEICPEELI